jgi:hypothetical protein
MHQVTITGLRRVSKPRIPRVRYAFGTCSLPSFARQSPSDKHCDGPYRTNESIALRASSVLDSNHDDNRDYRYRNTD